MSEQLRQDLQRECDTRKVTVIAGAGVSMAATRGARVASWPGLLEAGLQWCVDVGQLTTERADTWRQLVRSADDTEDLLLVAERITTLLGGRASGEYRRWLQHAFQEPPLRDSAVLKALGALGAPILTTNYDDLIERVTKLPHLTWRQGPQLAEFVRLERQAIVHLHGYWDDAESVVLGMRSYEDILRDALTQSALRTLVATRTLVFVGMRVDGGLSDPNFAALRAWICEVLGSSTQRHYVLVKEDEIALARSFLPLQGRVLPVSYGSTHGDLPVFLRRLAPPPAQQRQPRPSGVSGARKPANLTVVLGLEAEHLTRKYYRQDEFLGSAVADWPRLETTLQRWQTVPSVPASHDFCEALFAALLPALDDPLFPQLWAGASPFFAPTRLRIHAEASAPALLTALPWHLAAWRHQTLPGSGWTFEHVATPPQDRVALPTLHLQAPFAVVLMIPDDSLAPGGQEHADDLRSLLRDTWPTIIEYVHLARTAAEFEALCQTQRPRLVYFYGPAAMALPVQDFLPQACRADIVFLNMLGAAGPALPPEAARLAPGRPLPLLLAQSVATAAALQARQTCRAWLKAVLETSGPVAALHAHGHPHAVAWSACGDIRIDRVRRHTALPRERLAALLLDRTEERMLVRETLDYLARQQDKRVGCCIAFAAPGNHIDLFPEQADYYIRENAGEKFSLKIVQVHEPFALHMPAQETFTMALRQRFQVLDGALETTLERGLKAFRLREFAAVGNRKMPVLLLDWGVWRPLRPGDIAGLLQTWTEFCERELSRACPASLRLRLLSYVAIETPTEHHQSIRDAVDALEALYLRNPNAALHVERAAHLDSVSERELQKFVSEHARHLGQPTAAQRSSLVQHLYRVTQGRYDALLRLLRELVDDGPSIVLARWHPPSQPHTVE